MAKAHMGPGPLGLGPFLIERTPHQKTHPGKKSPDCVFCVFFWKQKRCAASVRSFSTNFRAEISAMCQKTKVFVFEKGRNLVQVFSIPIFQVGPNGWQVLIFVFLTKWQIPI